MRALCVMVAFVATASVAGAQVTPPAVLKPGATVFVHPMTDGFDTFFKAALVEKKVPLVVVESREQAQFEIKGASETEKAGVAKKVFLQSWHSDEQASISVTSVESGEIVYAYSTNKKNSARGKRTSAESCAKHLKDAVEKPK